MTSQSLGIVDNVADAITRLRYLESKTADDTALIALLQRQKDGLAQELADLKHNAGVDMFALQQERDEAVKKAADVQAIIENIGGIALSGIRRIKGDESVSHQPMKAAPQSSPEPYTTTPMPPKPSPLDSSRPLAIERLR